VKRKGKKKKPTQTKKWRTKAMSEDQDKKKD
jgi:hypothetical protein